MGPFVGIITSALLFIGMLVGATHHAQAPGEFAEIEQLRKDVERVNIVASQEVVGQVTRWNQRIARMKAYNKTWWGDIFIPDSWNEVSTIPVPAR